MSNIKDSKQPFTPTFTLPTPTLELDHLSTQLERDKPFTFLSNTPINNYNLQCTQDQYSFKTKKSCAELSHAPLQAIQPSLFNGRDETFEIDDSISSCPDFSSTGSISNLDSFNNFFDFSNTGVVVDSTTSANVSTDFSVTKVPNNTPVDSLAISGPDFLQDLNPETLSALLENEPLYDDNQQDPNGWDSLFQDEQSPSSANQSASMAPIPTVPVSTGSIPSTAIPTANASITANNTATATPAFNMKFAFEKSTEIIFGKPEDHQFAMLPGSRKRSHSASSSESTMLTPPTSVTNNTAYSSSNPSVSSTSIENPIYVENPDDRRAVKRARNTMAARRSRDRKRREVDDLKQKVMEQQTMITQLLTEVNLLRSMNSLPPRA